MRSTLLVECIVYSVDARTIFCACSVGSCYLHISGSVERTALE